MQLETLLIASSSQVTKSYMDIRSIVLDSEEDERRPRKKAYMSFRSVATAVGSLFLKSQSKEVPKDGVVDLGMDICRFCIDR